LVGLVFFLTILSFSQIPIKVGVDSAQAFIVIPSLLRQAQGSVCWVFSIGLVMGGLCLSKTHKKSWSRQNPSFCETGLHLENIVQSYKNLHCLTNQDEEKTKSNIITILIINDQMSFARIFYKNFAFFSNFFKNYL